MTPTAPPPELAPLRIAYFSPLPPSHSGIADYSRELLPHLAAHAELTLFCAAPEAVDATLRAQFPALPLADYPARRWRFDLALFQMGNSIHHAAIYDVLRCFPGVVVLHEAVLHHFMRERTLGQGDWGGYGRELAYALGDDGWQLACAIRSGQAAAPLQAVPLSDRVIDLSLGLIVHSQFAAAHARRRRPDLPLAVIPALIEPHQGHDRRAALGLPDDALIYGSFGQITAEKQIDRALHAFRAVCERYPNAHYLLVGEALPDVDLGDLVKTLGLQASVHRVGYAPDLATFVDWIHTADVVVNLRHPTMGETSATALRALAAGKALVVFDHGWYSEIPDDAALKLPPLDAAALPAALLQLAAAPELRASLGQAGQAYARRACAPRAVAVAYATFLREVIAKFGAARA